MKDGSLLFDWASTSTKEKAFSTFPDPNHPSKRDSFGSRGMTIENSTTPPWELCSFVRLGDLKFFERDGLCIGSLPSKAKLEA